MEPGGSKSNNLVDKMLRCLPIDEGCCFLEIFGEPAAYVNVIEENMVNQDTTTKSTAFTYSFANILNRNSNLNKKIVKLQELRNPERVEGAAVAIPMEAVEEFNTKEGMESVMESGPWLVRGVPLILNIWNQNSDLKKDVINLLKIDVEVRMEYSVVNMKLQLDNNAPVQKKVNVMKSNAIPTQNSFGALTDDEDKGDKTTTILNEDSNCEEVDEEMVFDDRNGQMRSLWNALGHHKNYVRNRPWCLLGDFNATLFLEESTAGSSRIDIAMREFKECVDDIEVVDVTNSGLQYTWNQKPRGNDGILKKLDRIMANMAFISEFVGVHAVFKPYRNSDHSPSILSVPMAVQGKPKPFKFYNIITKHERFREIVQGTWCNEVSGFFMFCIVKKLKSMKKRLRKLLFEKGNMHANVDRLRVELDHCND
ncbi:RNA-directed DNA polymerase, eukaryota, reverse transcriptase zinc-binding domain protein [Tanacetum coccineum]